jgi:hypothetical protein
MIRSTVLRGAVVLVGQLLFAQEELWQIPPPLPQRTTYFGVAPFPDYNGDGYNDLLLSVLLDTALLTQSGAVQIVSGSDGSLLHQYIPTGNLIKAQYAGDMDRDGSPELALLTDCCGGPGMNVLHIWSPGRSQELWSQSGNFSGQYGYAMLGGIDVNGDGHSDFIITTSSLQESDIYVYDSSGALLYMLPVHQFGWVALSLANMGDLDGDNADDFIVGCGEPSLRGVLVLVSGRTGSILRFSYGLQPGDKLASMATNLGDLDGDGYNDYGAVNYWSASRSVIVAFSGRTGAVINSWLLNANSIIGNVDLDLDGVPDIVVGSNWPVSYPTAWGRSNAVSGRDGTSLWELDNTVGDYNWAYMSASLGTQPGSPYPAIAWLDLNYTDPVHNTYPASGRVRAFRCSLAGQGPVTGVPCSSSSLQPQIGVRQTATGGRLTVSHAPTGSVAVLCLALAGQNTYGGFTMPLSLDPFGLRGCNLYVPPSAMLAIVAGTVSIDRGYAFANLGHNLAGAGLGTAYNAQWVVFDPATGGYAATAKHQLRVQ